VRRNSVNDITDSIILNDIKNLNRFKNNTDGVKTTRSFQAACDKV